MGGPHDKILLFLGCWRWGPYGPWPTRRSVSESRSKVRRGQGRFNQINRSPMSNFHSLSTYVDHTNFKSYFPRQLGHFYFLFLCVFYDFFHWNSLGPIEISYGMGVTKMSVFHLLSNLLFNWIPFHKNQFLQKIDSVHFDLQGANNSKSLFIIPKFDLHADIASQSQKWAKITRFYSEVEEEINNMLQS